MAWLRMLKGNDQIMIKLASDKFLYVLPIASEWAEAKEKVVLKNGDPLSNSQIEDAKRVGVLRPERVRMLRVPQIPFPKHPVLKSAAESIQLFTPDAVSLTVRYGIFIHSDFSDDRCLIIHELVHTSQYEKLGGFLPFIRKYLLQLINIGYPDAPLEQEAIKIAKRICRT
ncbi:MAG: hypothetical protein LJE66_06230 [Desulfobacterales bacterium]|jgi:hypothetical protein|nr:hypothetical protein [Desulfobacterales bacterium]